MRSRFAALVVCLATVGCGGDSSTPTAPTVVAPPPPAQISGTWSGTFESNYSPEAVAMNLTQVGTTITGTWAMTSGVRATGNVSGAVDTSQFTGIITYSLGTNTCQASFSGSANSSNLAWSSPGFTGACGLTSPGNPVNVRFVLQRR